MNKIEGCGEQINAINFYFEELKEISAFIPYEELQITSKMVPA
jgi:hypothetical protein